MQERYPNPQDLEVKPSHIAGATAIVSAAEKLRRGPHPGATGTAAPLPPAKRGPPRTAGQLRGGMRPEFPIAILDGIFLCHCLFSAPLRGQTAARPQRGASPGAAFPGWGGRKKKNSLKKTHKTPHIAYARARETPQSGAALFLPSSRWQPRRPPRQSPHPSSKMAAPPRWRRLSQHLRWRPRCSTTVYLAQRVQVSPQRRQSLVIYLFIYMFTCPPRRPLLEVTRLRGRRCGACREAKWAVAGQEAVAAGRGPGRSDAVPVAVTWVPPRWRLPREASDNRPRPLSPSLPLPARRHARPGPAAPRAARR